jgi:nitrogen fixation/metabolism regulation signal transduction histidine kinase
MHFSKLIDIGTTLSKLGRPFYTTKENGTGLGFMISKKIIENHFGDVHTRVNQTKEQRLMSFCP